MPVGCLCLLREVNGQILPKTRDWIIIYGGLVLIGDCFLGHCILFVATDSHVINVISRYSILTSSGGARILTPGGADFIGIYIYYIIKFLFTNKLHLYIEMILP